MQVSNISGSSCLTEKDKTVQQVTEASDDDSATESEFENDYDDDDAEACELRSESVNSVLTKIYHHCIVLLI